MFDLFIIFIYFHFEFYYFGFIFGSVDPFVEEKEKDLLW